MKASLLCWYYLNINQPIIPLILFVNFRKKRIQGIITLHTIVMADVCSDENRDYSEEFPK